MNEVLDDLTAIYEIPDPDKVEQFIAQNPDLNSILEDAPIYIDKIFGEDNNKVLEIHSDPEAEWDELFLIIQTPYSPQENIILEKKLFDSWFVNISRQVKNKFNFIAESI